jgi:hypothetical protein
MQQILIQDKNTKNRNKILWYLATVTAPAMLYALICPPTVVWRDGDILIYKVRQNNIAAKSMLTRSDPLYIAPAMNIKHIPFGETSLHNYDFKKGILWKMVR